MVQKKKVFIEKGSRNLQLKYQFFEIHPINSALMHKHSEN